MDAWSWLPDKSQVVEKDYPRLRWGTFPLGQGTCGMSDTIIWILLAQTIVQARGEAPPSVTAAALQAMDESKDNSEEEEILKGVAAMVYAGQHFSTET